RRQREAEDALDRGRIDGHCRGGEVLPQQSLDDQPAERVADGDRLGVQPPDDPGVVLDDVLDAVTGDELGFVPGLRDRARVTRPAGRDRRVSSLPEAVDPRPPRVGMEPQTVDEYDRRAVWRHDLPSTLLARAPRAQAGNRAPGG